MRNPPLVTPGMNFLTPQKIPRRGLVGVVCSASALFKKTLGGYPSKSGCRSRPLSGSIPASVWIHLVMARFIPKPTLGVSTIRHSNSKGLPVRG
jgi:hypothetical protein